MLLFQIDWKIFTSLYRYDKRLFTYWMFDACNWHSNYILIAVFGFEKKGLCANRLILLFWHVKNEGCLSRFATKVYFQYMYIFFTIKPGLLWNCFINLLVILKFIFYLKKKKVLKDYLSHSNIFILTRCVDVFVNVG